MKNKLLIFVAIILASCKSDTNKFENASDYVVEEESILEIEENIVEKTIIENNTFKYKAISTEKLQEFLDLIVLQQKHPEFSEDISSQLKNYTNDALSDYKNFNETLIKNIQLKGDIIKLNDSTEKMKLTYNLVSNNHTKQDSIWAEITTNSINLDGTKMQSRKIRFNKIK